ncbi:MAG: hypothetical protein S4CHLAM6_07700 [Chlamydiae bacterium]|nr:hypothetical protein [Chlamydiota bacterium]
MWSTIKVFTVCVFFLLTGCSQVTWPCLCGCSGSKHISVLNEPINHGRLASTHVNAPDPLHELNAHGQRLYVSWSLPKLYKGAQLNGILKVRFNISEQVTIPFKIERLKGTITYQIINEEYFQKEGIQSYKVQIFSDGKELDCFQHTMWTELISGN